VRISCFTLAFFAIVAASLAVRCLRSLARSASFCVKEASETRMSESFAREMVFLFGAVSMMNVTFLPFSL